MPATHLRIRHFGCPVQCFPHTEAPDKERPNHNTHHHERHRGQEELHPEHLLVEAMSSSTLPLEIREPLVGSESDSDDEAVQSTNAHDLQVVRDFVRSSDLFNGGVRVIKVGMVIEG